MIDAQVAHDARDDLHWTAYQWPQLQARLTPGRGGGLTGMPGRSPDPPAPINLHIADLMVSIDTETRARSRQLAHELPDPSKWRPTSRMPGLLHQVADRYGHWTMSENILVALDFCDWAHHTRNQVQRAIEQPAPARYIGPCQIPGCDGELYLPPGRFVANCPKCRTQTPEVDQLKWVRTQLLDRLMTRHEIRTALVILGLPTKPDTIDKWITRNRLPNVGDGLYRLTTALDLARTGRPRHAA